MNLLQLSLIVSVAVALCGFVMYAFDVVRGDIHRYTRWNELSTDQWAYVIMMLGGVSSFIVTLVVMTIVKA